MRGVRQVQQAAQVFRAVVAFGHLQVVPGQICAQGGRVERDGATGNPTPVAAGAEPRPYREIARAGQKDRGGQLVGVGGDDLAQRPGDGTEKTHCTASFVASAACRWRYSTATSIRRVMAKELSRIFSAFFTSVMSLVNASYCSDGQT